MCGIAGYLTFGDFKFGESPIDRMVDSLAHRGPDDRGVHHDGNAVLGHRRLSIIDLTDAGRQPMCNEDGSIWLTFNGEIYDYPEIRNTLIKLGHVFRSATDTEVIIHAYEQWGYNCLERFNGMFAFALWDKNIGKLWLVRDRLGIKPLFYLVKDNFIGFGSEIKSLLTLPLGGLDLDLETLGYYLSLNWVPNPRTMLKDIRQLSPATFLETDLTGSLKLFNYWQLPSIIEPTRPFKEIKDEFDHLLENAVARRLRADVPSGVFLSGGLDSSSLAYHASKLQTKKVKSFSYRFSESSYDESPYAQLVADQLGTEHYNLFADQQPEELLKKIVYHAEEPTADSSMIPMYNLARETRKHVKMVLSGDGADEILAGYETYQAFYLARIFRSIPLQLRRWIINPLIESLPVSFSKVSFESKLKRFVRACATSGEEIHAGWRIICDQQQKASLLAPIWHDPDVRKSVQDLYHKHFLECNAKKQLNRLMWIDTSLYLPSDMLIKVDRMTMAHGLEARVPFLDHKLVEFCMKLEPKYKLRHGIEKKYILKKAMYGKLPSSILKRSKQGFNVPISIWINGNLKEFIGDNLSNSAIRNTGLFDAIAVERILNDHYRMKADYSHQIWSLLIFMLWFELFFKGNGFSTG